MTKEKILKHLNKNGLEGKSLVEAWYSDHVKARDLLDKLIPTFGQKIEKQIRWETEPGKKALEIIKSRIVSLQNDTADRNSERVRNGNYQIEKTTIDFNQILIGGLSISQFMYTNIPHLYSTGGWVDLSGIPLKWIRLQNCIIQNAQLSLGVFDYSSFYNVEFFNCNLNDCSFKNCRIGFIRFGDQSGSFSNADLTDSFVNAIDFSSKYWGGAIIKKISYLELLKISIAGKNNFNKNSRYTSFLACTVGIDNEHKSYKEKSDYVIWFQETVAILTSVDNHKPSLRREKIRIINILNILFTKNWSSISAIFFSAGLIILLFSIIYFLNKEYFLSLNNFGDSFNFSAQIFTGLGYADIKPDLSKGWIGNTIITIENFIGYIWISLMLIVIGKKIFK